MPHIYHFLESPINSMHLVLWDADVSSMKSDLSRGQSKLVVHYAAKKLFLVLFALNQRENPKEYSEIKYLPRGLKHRASLSL